MFALIACVAIAVLMFGLIFYQNYAEKQRARRMMRLIRRRRAHSQDRPA